MAAVAYPIPHDRRVRPRRAPGDLRVVAPGDLRVVAPGGLRVVAPGGCRHPRPAARAVSHRTYLRRRAVAVLLLAGVLLAARWVVGTLGGGPLATPEPVVPRTIPAAARVYVVQPGDTLWGIARALDPRGDPRVTAQRLIAAHGGSSLQVGDRVTLP